MSPAHAQRWQKAWRALRRSAYWVLPPLLLYLVARHIDAPAMIALLRRVDVPLLALGITLSGGVVALGAMRWHLPRRATLSPPPTFGATLLVYWRAVALGAVTPGSVGTDVYRIAHDARRGGRVIAPTVLVLTEKLGALLACGLLLVSIVPRLGVPGLPHAQSTAYALGVIAVALGLLPWVWSRAGRTWPALQRAGAYVVERVEAAAARWAARAQLSHDPVPGDRDAARPLRWGHALLAMVAVSLAVFAVSALQAQCFFLAFGVEVPYAVNLAVTPLLFLVLSLPISLGTLGVREVAFIGLYGAFGVAAEVALLVSLCGLVAMWCGHAIGGLLWFIDARAAAVRGTVTRAATRPRP